MNSFYENRDEESVFDSKFDFRIQVVSVQETAVAELEEGVVVGNVGHAFD
jgi:hypothetical protein